MKKALRKAALKLVRPTKKEEREVLEFMDRLQSGLSSRLPHGVEVMPAGSVVKGTFLRGAGDVDLFALFPPSYKKERMFRTVMKAASEAFPRGKREVSYAEHPYVRMHLEGRKVDIVPAYVMLEGERVRSAVDRSQLHTKFILRNMGEEQKDDVRLLKRFLRVHSLYGAEIRVLGLSGYLCELLVLEYGGFESALRAAAGWKPPVAVDHLNHYMSKGEALKAFSSPPIAVVDPVDRERNVAAALTAENLARFTLLARRFLKKPSLSFFREPRELPLASLRRAISGRAISGLRFRVGEEVEDILWGQLRRFTHMLQSHLEKEGFTVLGALPRLQSKDALVLFEVLEAELPEMQLIPGPYAHMADDCGRFMSAHRGSPIVVRDSRIYALAGRKVRTPEDAAKSFRKKLGSSFPSRLKAGAKKAKFMSGRELLRHSKALSAYLQQ